MSELRWILLGLGVLLIAGVYLLGRSGFSLSAGLQKLGNRRSEQTPPDELDDDQDDLAADAQLSATPARDLPEKILTLRVVPREEELSSEQAVLALREAGLQHGKYVIFHCPSATSAEETLFSVASLVEPGSFDLADLKESKIPGMSFFMILPGTGDPVDRFDQMVQTARNIAQELDAEMFDERGSSWSIQRERYLREEVIEYRHQLSRF